MLTCYHANVVQSIHVPSTLVILSLLLGMTVLDLLHV